MPVSDSPRSPSETVRPDLSAYQGRWVALLQGQVVGQGLTRSQALEAARSSRPKERPSVHLVPPPAGAPLGDLLNLLQPVLPADEPIHVVGGAIRDHLLHAPIHDVDFTTSSSGLPIARRAADLLGAEFYPLDEARGTGRVLILRPNGTRLLLDFAALRGADLEEDLRGRDFTINAIAMDAHDTGRVFDPLGGASDLRAKQLKTCSETSFSDDPLRVLRAVRFAAQLGLQMTAVTRDRLRASAPALGQVSPERQRDEILKILGGRKPAAALRALDVLGVLPHVFPDLPAMKGVTQSPPHVHDVWEHTLSVISHLERLLNLLASLEHDEEAAANLFLGLAVMRLGRYRSQIHQLLLEEMVPDRPWRGLLFLAALYHDAGKPAARSLDEAGRIRFLGHEEVSARLLKARANALRLSNEEALRLRNVARHHMRPHHLAGAAQSPSRRAIFRFFRDTQVAGVDIALLGLADTLGTYERTLPQELWGKYLDLARELMENWWERPEESIRPAPLLNGSDLIQRFDVKPGPQIGELLKALLEAQASGEIAEKEEAEAFIRHILSQDE